LIDCIIHPHRIPSLCPSVSPLSKVRCACPLLLLSLPPTCVDRVLPARSVVVEGCCLYPRARRNTQPPSFTKPQSTPRSTKSPSASSAPAHAACKYFSLSQSTHPPAGCHHRDFLRDLTRPTRPRQDKQHVVFIIQRRRRALPRRQEDRRGFFRCHLRGHQSVEQHPGRH